jgi:hypothetical protein
LAREKKALVRVKKPMGHKKMPLARQKNVGFCAKIFKNCPKMKKFTKSRKKTIFLCKLRWRAPTAYLLLTVFFARANIL